MQDLRVDVSLRPDLIGWQWDENLTVFWPVRQQDGTIQWVPAMAASDQTMAVVPAEIHRGMAVTAPQHVALAPRLFKQQVGIPAQAVYAASMASLMQQIGQEASVNRQHYMRDKLEEECSLFLQCAKVSPIFTFPAWVKHSNHGAAVMFCGKPWGNPWMRTPDTAAATLLNDPWHRTSVAGELVRLAQQANAAAEDAIPCARTLSERAAALTKWHQLMVKADQVAHQFLQDNLPGWAGQSVGFTPTAKPYMATLEGVADHIRLGRLRVPEPHLQVGGCHIELPA